MSSLRRESIALPEIIPGTTLASAQRSKLDVVHIGVCTRSSFQRGLYTTVDSISSKPRGSD